MSEAPNWLADVVSSGSDTCDTRDTVLEGTVLDDRLLAAVRDGAWLDGQSFPPLRYVVPGVIPEGQTLLVGPPKAGKSWLTLGVLLAVASGGHAFGKIPVGAKRRVLYLALEDGDRRMQERCRTLLDGEPIPPLFHYLTVAPSGQVVAMIEAFLRKYPDTCLVVIDTLGKVMPPAAPGESAYQRDYRVGGALKRIADEHDGLAVVVLHHDRKAASEDFVDSVSGTHGLAGAADTVIVLARKRQQADGLLMVTGRDVAEAEYALMTADGRWTLDGRDLEESAARARARVESAGLAVTTTSILDFVRQRSPEGVRAKEVEELFGPDARRYLTRQVEAGRLVKLARGLYAAPPTPLSQVSQVSEQTMLGPAEES